MDTSVNQQTPVTQHPGGVLAGLRIVLSWLADLIQLTEEDLENAGVYLSD